MKQKYVSKELSISKETSEQVRLICLARLLTPDLHTNLLQYLQKHLEKLPERPDSLLTVCDALTLKVSDHYAEREIAYLAEHEHVQIPAHDCEQDVAKH